jgi:DNA-binding winged helix-turn-helix (wHTH) protein
MIIPPGFSGLHLSKPALLLVSCASVPENGGEVLGRRWDISLKELSDRVFLFGPFRLNPRERLLFKGEEVVPLTPKAFQILLALVESHGHVVHKEDLLKRIWTDTFVEESNLTWNIHALRRALGETDQSKFIATVPKVGFRFSEQ